MAALILFGGGGDLAMRMLLPSLYFLEHDGLLPDGLKIIAAARSHESRDEYVARVRLAVEGKARADDAWSDAAWARLNARLDLERSRARRAGLESVVWHDEPPAVERRPQ